MFLKPDGLKELLLQEEWDKKFREFIKISSRMSDIELKKIYGDTQLFAYPTSLDDYLNISQRDKLTYGEFLRRHHASIAEYVAIYGFPGRIKIDLLTDFDEEQRKIIGLIAKSHCMELRSAVEEGEKKLMGKKGAYRPSNVPIVYLMTLLRIGDILDMGKDRAPHILSDMQQFSSPLSKDEWEWNQTIDSSNFNWGIAKTLYIQSEPQNTIQFIKVEKNLKWFQTELDFAWAALCDYYGNEFNLTIHRIESNIFEQKDLFRSKFFTKEAKIKIASNLSNLLVDPLYHGNPYYAVRELIQNSVDACNFRKKIERKRGNTYVGKIQVNVDTHNKLFYIKDNGIGMDEDVIINYYLTVGANFRNSDYWTKALEEDDDSKNNIIRVGRFGVGFLATFLLGNRITVTTRHLNDEEGYQFNVTLEDENISAERVKGVEIGTEIKIYMNKKSTKINWKIEKGRFFNKFEYPAKIAWNEWYHCVNPEICYMVDGEVVNPELNFKIPDDLNVNTNWIQLESNVFDKVSYGFFSLPNGTIINQSFLGDCNLLSNVVVNGFLVNDNARFMDTWWLPDDIVVCSITDENNLLGLDLSRTNMNYNHKIFELINIELWKWQLAEILCYKTPQIKGHNGVKQSVTKYKTHDGCPDGILYKKDSFSFFHPYFLSKLFIDKFYIIKEPLEVLPSCDYIQTKTLDSNWPFLLYNKKDFRDKFISKYGNISKKSNHLFELVDVKHLKIPYNSTFVKLIDDIFSDAPDLWIPYDFNERKKKFKKAFKLLASYTKNGELSLKDNKKNEGVWAIEPPSRSRQIYFW